MLREAIAPVANAMGFGLVAFLSLNVLCLFYREYESVSAKLQGEAWLHEKCQDPFFFSNMTSHTDICECPACVRDCS